MRDVGGVFMMDISGVFMQIVLSIHGSSPFPFFLLGFLLYLRLPFFRFRSPLFQSYLYVHVHNVIYGRHFHNLFLLFLAVNVMFLAQHSGPQTTIKMTSIIYIERSEANDLYKYIS